MKLDKEIWRLTLPNIVSNITVPLVGLVDMALMGHLDSVVYVGAIALGSVIFNFIYWSLGFLRMSTSGLTAQAVGRGDTKEAALVLLRALTITGLASVFLLSIQYPIEQLGMYILAGSDEVKQLASEYFYIRIWAAPASLALFAFNGWFLGKQNSKIPMTITVVINVLNLLFNFLFVYGFNMKSAGVAYGTVVAQYSGLILATFFLIRHFPDTIKWFKLKFVWPLRELKSYLSVSGDIFFRTLCVIFVFTFFTAKGGAQSDELLAVNNLLLQFLMLFSFVMDALAYAAEAIVGRFAGANDKAMVLKSIKRLFIWGGLSCLLMSVVYFFMGDAILRLLSNQDVIINGAKPYMVWVALIPIVSFASFLWDGIYIGTTASRAMLITMFVATFGMFVPVYFLTFDTLANHGLWLAMLSFFFGRGLFQTLLAPSRIFRKL